MAGYLVMATGMAIGAIAGHGVALLGFSLAAFMFFAMQSIIFNWLPSIMSGHMLAGSFGLLNCLGLCGASGRLFSARLRTAPVRQRPAYGSLSRY